MKYSPGDKVRLGGISGTIVSSHEEEGSTIYSVNLGGVLCECSENEIRNKFPPHEWEVACGK